MVWSGMGLNMGGDLHGAGVFHADSVDTELTYLKSLGFTKIRVSAVNEGDSTGMANEKLLAQACVAKGFDTSWGSGPAGNPITLTAWNTYLSNLPTYVAWAVANGVTRFQFANEVERVVDGTTLTATQVINDIISTTASLNAAYPAMPIYYSVAESWISSWTPKVNSLGNLTLGFDIYGGSTPYNRAQFQTNLNTIVSTFGNKAFLSEFGIASTWSGSWTTDDEFQTVELANRVAIVKASGISSAYFFAWRTGDNTFAVKNIDNSLNLMWCSVVNGRRFLTS